MSSDFVLSAGDRHASEKPERLVAGPDRNTGASRLCGAGGNELYAGRGLPLDWVNKDQEHHIRGHRLDNILTMTVPPHRSSHRNLVLDTTCLVCGAQPETAPHFRACSA